MNIIARLRSYWETWSVRIVALLTGLMGAINVVSAVTPSLADRLRLLRQISPLEIRHGGHLTAALAGFALLLLARALWRRKRVAWLLTLIVLVISIASHLLKGLDYEEATFASALALGLLFLRSHFHARSDPPSIWQGLRALIAALLFTLTYGVIGFYLLGQHFGANLGLWAALEQTVIMFTQFYDPGLVPMTHFGQYFADSIYMVGGATLAYALWMLLRPVLVRQPATDQEHKRAEAIAQAYGRTALARFALFDDKSYYFSQGGSMLAYMVEGRGALALGDPIGPIEDVPTAVAGFQQYCARNDWLPAFYQTLPDYLEHYRAAGLEIAYIGNEAIVDTTSFSLLGGANKALRTPIAKLTRLGHQTHFYKPPLPDNLMHELRNISDEWLTTMNRPEVRFSLGSFDDGYVRNSPVMVVRTPEGYVSAFANLVQEYQHNGLSLDLMRRRRQVENGTMEFLFVGIIEWAKSHGYATFDMGLSALAGVGDDADDPAVEKALHYIYEHIYHFYNFKGLHAFKVKFHPQWSPRYLVYPGTTSLPAVALALIRADSGMDVTLQDIKDWIGKRLRHTQGQQEDLPRLAAQSSEQGKSDR